MLRCDRRLIYLPVKSCFNIHKENNTVNKAIPTDATSATIATFSSHENRFEQNNKWGNRSTVFSAGKGFFAKAFLLELHIIFFALGFKRKFSLLFNVEIEGAP